MDLCKKCCSFCLKQPKEVCAVRYAELSHDDPGHPEKLFNFPQVTESRPSYPPMFETATKRINSPHAKKLRRVFMYQPQPSVPMIRLYGAPEKQNLMAKPVMLPTRRTHTRSLSDIVRKQPHASSFTSSPHASTVAQITGKEFGTIHVGGNPTLQFSLDYDVVHSVLTVHLLSACNLPAMDRCGTSDPYVEVILYPNQDKAKSKIVEKCLNPIFDEKLIFKNVYPCDTGDMKLQLYVYDHDKITKDDKIGEVTISLEDADLTGSMRPFDIEMHKKERKTSNADSSGTILLSLSYDDYSNNLKGMVVRLGNLTKKDMIGTSDPYVKVKLLHQEKKLRKWKSSTKTNDLNPDFHESFQFDLQDQSINGCKLCFTVYDHDHVKPDDVIGRVCIGPDVAQIDGRKHWEEMLVSPQEVCRYHFLQRP